MKVIMKILIVIFFLISQISALEKLGNDENKFTVIDAIDCSSFCVYLARPASRFLGWDSRYFYLSKPCITEKVLPIDQELPFGYVVRLQKSLIDKKRLRIALEHKVYCVGYEDIRQTPPSKEYRDWVKETPRTGELVVNSIRDVDVDALLAEAFQANGP